MKRKIGVVSLVLFAVTVGTAFLFPAKIKAHVKSRVILEYGDTPSRLERIGYILSTALQEINKIDEGVGNIENLHQYCTPQGFKTLKDLVENTGFFSNIPEYRTNLIKTPNGQHEVRGIIVNVKMGDTEGEPTQHLVFVFNSYDNIINVHFAMEEEHYERIVEDGYKLDDMFLRKQVLDFLEDFRTAYNSKNIDYLQKVYSDDALIIVGRVLERQKTEKNDFIITSLGDNKIQFIKLSKQQYIGRLQRVFQLNSFVNVIFDQAEVMRHPLFPEIYGINVKQRWNSSTYNDEGYLFIMMDFRYKDRPLIKVRCWQPKPFEDGTLVRLGDFEIIR